MADAKKETLKKSTDNGKIDEPIDEVPLYSKKRVMIPLIISAAVVMIAIVCWYLSIAGTIYTDDAYVDGNRVIVSSKYTGRISELKAEEGDNVKTGQVLVKLDDSDLSAQEKQSKSALEYARQNLELATVNSSKNEEDYARAENQFTNNVITKEQFDHAKKSLEAAKAQDAIAQAQIDSASAQLGVIRAQLKNIVIESPMNGIVAKKWAMPGDVVQVAQPILTVYDISNLWITANLEETKFGRIHLNQTVYVYIDAYKKHKFTGKVIQLGANTASQFSLIPPNNASGNFTKVTQRIPVKISIDLNQDSNKIESVRILPGMSAEVRLNTK
ncbi:MAG: HlyD family secretion protein [Endomicrobiales bacterium]|nr:HlyD family secretion protein [Endomicrobiales bacterium]